MTLDVPPTLFYYQSSGVFRKAIHNGHFLELDTDQLGQKQFPDARIFPKGPGGSNRKLG